MKNEKEIVCEKAVRFLAEYTKISVRESKKPRLMHGLRVGMFLYEHGCDQNVVVAGFLHDVIEWSGVDAGIIKDEFGCYARDLVIANSKNRAIVKGKNIDMIQRCVTCGQEALIIKAADIIDSFLWYESQNNTEELQNHCLATANIIFHMKPKEWQNDIFDELRIWQKKYLKIFKP